MSNMVVRTNVFAINAHRNLTNVGLAQRTSAQRLSSGFRVNSAADDAAGLAISEAMRAQIRGLDQASINSQDAIGLIQTAEGAMATISDMVIRMRELIVQAANDTNTWENREMIQLEIDQLMMEINDVTFRTQFNTRTLLDGGISGGGGPSSPVSLQWMVFQQARVIGLPHPGGTVGPTGLHPNPNNKNETSLRHGIIGLQTEIDALARRVADRLVASGGMSSTQRNEMFDGYPRDFSELIPHMVSAELQQMQNIQSRLESDLRNALRTAAEVYQITQDQIRALGGMGAINADGSNVFIQQALEEWNAAADGARARLVAIRDAMIGGGTVSAPQGVLGDVRNVSDIQSLYQILIDLVGYPSGAVTAIGAHAVSAFCGCAACLAAASPISGASAGIVSSSIAPSPAMIAPMSAPSAPPERTIDINSLTDTIPSNGYWSFNATTNVLTILADGDFQINGNGSVSDNRIVVNPGLNANIGIYNVNIDTNVGPALNLGHPYSGTSVNLWLEGDNTLQVTNSTFGFAGVGVSVGNAIVINGSGTLTAQGSGRDSNAGAGIGGSYALSSSTAGDITINGGTIRATGGFDGAGIGGGFRGGGGNVTVNGSDTVVIATGGACSSSVGIGVGCNFLGGTMIHGGSLTINDGRVTVANGNPATTPDSNERIAFGGGASASLTINGGLFEVLRYDGTVGADSAAHTVTVNGGNLSVPPAALLGTIRNSAGHEVSRVRIYLFDPGAAQPYMAHEFPSFTALPYDINGQTINAITDSNGLLFMFLPRNSVGAEGEMTFNGVDLHGLLRNQVFDGETDALVFAPYNHYARPPIIGEANRTGPTTGTANFISSWEGEFFYVARRADDPSPPPDAAYLIANGMQGSGAVGNNTIPLTGLEDGYEYRIFVMLRDDAEDINSNVLNLLVPASVPRPPPNGNGHLVDGEGLIYEIERLLGLSLGVLGTVNLESNAMWFQLGPNALQGMVMQLRGMHTGILGGGRGDLTTLIDVRKESGIPISEQLKIIDMAEGIVNAQRAQLGAVQNRLEFTRKSVDISSENLKAAESRIRDADMALEMMRFTQAQVLQQAGISMLAQANQLPQAILQLLQ